MDFIKSEQEAFVIDVTPELAKKCLIPVLATEI